MFKILIYSDKQNFKIIIYRYSLSSLKISKMYCENWPHIKDYFNVIGMIFGCFKAVTIWYQKYLVHDSLFAPNLLIFSF